MGFYSPYDVVSKVYLFKTITDWRDININVNYSLSRQTVCNPSEHDTSEWVLIGGFSYQMDNFVFWRRK